MALQAVDVLFPTRMPNDIGWALGTAPKKTLRKPSKKALTAAQEARSSQLWPRRASVLDLSTGTSVQRNHMRRVLVAERCRDARADKISQLRAMKRSRRAWAACMRCDIGLTQE